VARIEQDVLLGERYRLRKRIATGGMGAVWEAEDTVLRRRVAVKVLSDSLGGNPAFVERFRREAQAAAGLSHPHVAGVYDYGEHAETPFIVMELFDGENLAERMARSPRLPPEEAARIAAEAAEALDAAHAAGVIHRDVKPGNIMIDGKGTVRVLDFGIAAASWAAPLTATGTTLGTASYLSPEQAMGGKAAPASDVYALGCVLYEMLTGAPPFSADSPVALAAAHARETPAPVIERAPDVPAELAEACRRSLAKDPSARPSAAAFAQMLHPAAGAAAAAGAVAAAPQATTQVLSPERTAVLPEDAAGTTPASAPGTRLAPRVGPWVWWILAALVAAAAIIILILLLVGGETPDRTGDRPPPSPARTQTQAPGPAVPAVVGLALDDALRELAAAGIDQAQVEATPGERGIVIDVDPEEGSTLTEGEPVTLFVGNGEEEGENGGGQGNGKGKGKGNGEGGD
jgi:eukaryotic-like serine/threonine-protein kinase